MYAYMYSICVYQYRLSSFAKKFTKKIKFPGILSIEFSRVYIPTQSTQHTQARSTPKTQLFGRFFNFFFYTPTWSTQRAQAQKPFESTRFPGIFQFLFYFSRNGMVFRTEPPLTRVLPGIHPYTVYTAITTRPQLKDEFFLRFSSFFLNSLFVSNICMLTMMHKMGF